jgi:hypothetical protein
MLTQSNPDTATRLLELAKKDVSMRWLQHKDLAARESHTSTALPVADGQQARPAESKGRPEKGAVATET